MIHLRGVVLPAGEEQDLWISEDLFVSEPAGEVLTLTTSGYIMPGLVDAHCHIGLGLSGGVDRETARIQAETDRNAGVLLIRDAGSPVDTHWADDISVLPRIVRAGHHIAAPKRYIRNYAVEVAPEQLVAQVEIEARRGDGWVKLVGDWIDRSCGDLAPLWPRDIAKKAIDTAHQLGARVTAHCFAEQSVQELVAAGIDCIEHGTGLDDATIDLMATHGTALVPTLINLAHFPDFAAAGREKFPMYAAHMLDLHARRRDTIGKAREAGVQIFAGTDAGGTIRHGRIADEIAELAQIGGADFALGAASWRSRKWLGAPAQLSVGAWADLVVYDADPRVNIAVISHPKHVILRGEIIF